MRLPALISILALLYASPASSQTVLSTGKLVDSCSSTDSRVVTICTAFIAGVASAALPATTVAALALGGVTEQNTLKAIEFSNKVFGCGEKFTASDTARHFISYVKERRINRSDPAVLSLTMMMVEKYTCPKPASATNLSSDSADDYVSGVFLCLKLADTLSRGDDFKLLSKLIAKMESDSIEVKSKKREYFERASAAVHDIKESRRTAVYEDSCSEPVRNLRSFYK